MSIKATNDTMGPNGLVPTLLVFGVLPKCPGPNATNSCQMERFEELRLSRSEMESIVAEIRINRALRSKLTPKKIKYYLEI